MSTMLSMAMWMLLIVTPVQIAIGDAHGLNDLKYQPAKIAAIEGHWENRARREPAAHPVRLARHERRDDALRGRKSLMLGSLVLTHDWNGQIPA